MYSTPRHAYAMRLDIRETDVFGSEGSPLVAMKEEDTCMCMYIYIYIYIYICMCMCSIIMTTNTNDDDNTSNTARRR